MHFRTRSTVIVLAMPVHPSCGHERQGPSPRPMKKGRRSAERRMPSSVRTIPPGGEGARKRSIADKPAQSARLICLRDRSPLGAPLRRLPRRANARTQSRPRFTRNTMRRRYLRLESRLSEAPRASVFVPRGTLPRPPGSGSDEPPPAGTASRSVSRRHRLTSLNDERDGAVMVIAAAKSNGLNCADESGPFAPRVFRQRARGALDSLACSLQRGQAWFFVCGHVSRAHPTVDPPIIWGYDN